MKKRIFFALLAAVLCVMLMPARVSAVELYSDVPEDHWSAESVYRATELGIFNGVGDGRFGRGESITRAAFVTALVRLFGWETVTPETPTFTDVGTDRWYYAAVETAVANDAIPVSSKTFRPTDPLTRSDMASILMRALGYTALAGAQSDRACPFTDVTANRGFIILAYDMGIVSGMGDGIYAPNANATREQAAAILVRLHDKLAQESVRRFALDGSVALRVDPPKATNGGTLPTTPLEPIGELYAALCAMKESGQDMSQVVLVLRSGGVSTVVLQGGEIVSSGSVSESHVDMVLTRNNARTYYSERYESAYCVYEPNYYQTVTIWYQSERSMAAKLQLAKLFGVTSYMME